MSSRRWPPVEAALWYNKDHPSEKDKAKEGVEIALVDFALGNGLMLGPVKWEDVDPLSPRVPAPPKKLQGSIRCLIGTAEIVGELVQLLPDRLTEELPEDQLIAMRKATRQAFYKAGGTRWLSDEEADEFINREGPGAAIPETLH